MIMNNLLNYLNSITILSAIVLWIMFFSNGTFASFIVSGCLGWIGGQIITRFMIELYNSGDRSKDE